MSRVKTLLSFVCFHFPSHHYIRTMPPEVDSLTETDINALSLNDQQLKRTSNWSTHNMDSFNMDIVNTKWSSKSATFVSENSLDVYTLVFNLIVSNSSDMVKYVDLKTSHKPFFNRLKLLRKRPNTPGVNIAYDLLINTGFEDGPIHFLSKVKLEKKISDMMVASDADYVVIGQFLPLVYMVVIEDTSGNETFEHRRLQMATDMMIAATIRHDFLSLDDCRPSSTHIYGMLVWKSEVSFYQAAFTTEDITKRQSGSSTFGKSTIIEEHTLFLEHETKVRFSLFDQGDRSSIVGILLEIKKEISSRISNL